MEDEKPGSRWKTSSRAGCQWLLVFHFQVLLSQDRNEALGTVRWADVRHRMQIARCWWTSKSLTDFWPHSNCDLEWPGSDFAKEQTVDMSTDTDDDQSHISIAVARGGPWWSCTGIPSLTSTPWWCFHSGMQPRPSPLFPSVLLDLTMFFRHLLQATPQPNQPLPRPKPLHLSLPIAGHCNQLYVFMSYWFPDFNKRLVLSKTLVYPSLWLCKDRQSAKGWQRATWLFSIFA